MVELFGPQHAASRSPTLAWTRVPRTRITVAVETADGSADDTATRSHQRDAEDFPRCGTNEWVKGNWSKRRMGVLAEGIFTEKLYFWVCIWDFFNIFNYMVHQWCGKDIFGCLVVIIL